ncbi:MAG TPA: hypothetical protein VFI31_08455 [Pirellulales bacterium]|nr:hypothetical protein [Pirellulales bacterium]
MSAKQPSPATSAAERHAPPVTRQKIVNAFVAVAFLALSVGYLVFYLESAVPELRGISRAHWLRVRTLLPEQAAARWFGSPPSLALQDRWPVLAAAAAIIASGWLIGCLVLAATSVESPTAGDSGEPETSPVRLTPLERFLLACGVGLNVLSLYVLAIGLAGRLSRAWFLIPAVCVAAGNAWLAWRRRLPAGEVAASADDGISVKWLWLAAPFVAAIFLGGMLPPIDFDVREYHLQAPKEFFQQGKIDFLPHNVYGNMPLGSEMFSLLGMVLAGDWWLGALVGKTVIAAFAPLTALALFSAGKRFASPSAGVVAAVLYLSIPWVTVVSTSGLIEGVLAFYLFLAVYAVLLWRQTPLASETSPVAWSQRDAFVAVAGLCSGAAVSCKYPAVLFVALPLLAYITVASGRTSWKAACIYLLALVASCGLWFAKNWALTGNPVYPLLYDWLGGATRNADNNQRWLQAHLPHDFSLATLANNLWAVVLRSSWLSPVLAPLAVMGLVVHRYRALALTLAGYFAYIVAAWWLCTHRIDRFWIPALPLLALLAGVGAVWSLSMAWRRVVLTVLVIGLSISFILVTSPDLTYNAYFVSLPTARLDSERVNLWHLVLNEQVPAGSTVLSVGDAQVFDLAVPVIYNTAFDQNLAGVIFEHRSPPEIADELHRRRVSHVYVNWNEVYRYRQPGNYGGMPDFLTPAWFAGLVRQGVLDRPWQHPLRRGHEVYPVKSPFVATGGLDHSPSIRAVAGD